MIKLFEVRNLRFQTDLVRSLPWLGHVPIDHQGSCCWLLHSMDWFQGKLKPNSPSFLLGKSMVSGVDFPLNQSIDTLNDITEASPENANKHQLHGHSSIQCKNKEVFFLLVRIISPFNLQKHAQGLNYPSTVDPWLMLNSPIYGKSKQIETHAANPSFDSMR